MADDITNVFVWCNICELKGDEKSASFWCFECNQSFCEDCEVHHRYSKVSKDHNEISINHFNALTDDMKFLRSHCAEHEMLFEFYCPDHNEPSCIMCTSGTHGSCAHQIPIRQILKTSTKEQFLSEHSRNIDEINDFISRLQQQREESLSDIKQQIDQCAKRFQSIRAEMNARLDELETNILNSLNKSLEEYSKESQQFTIELQKDKDRVLHIKKDLDILVEHATSFQVFLGKGEIQKMITKLEESAKSHPSKYPLQGIDLQAILTFDTESLFDHADLDNTVRMVTVPNTIEYVGGSCSHAQLSRVVSKTLDTLTLTPGEISMSFLGRYQCNIVGCSIRETGEYVFCDFSENKRILIFRSNGLLERIIKTKGKPCCLVFVDSSKLAVTFPNESKVKFIEYCSDTVLAETNLKTRCVGIGISKNTIVVSGSEDIFTLDFLGNILHTNSIDRYKNSVHLHCFDNFICVGGFIELRWLKSDFSFLRKYEFEDDEMIEGISSDLDNNIYLSCYTSNRVIVISENCDLEKELLNKDDGISLPTGLCFNQKKNQVLVVTNSKQCAVVYDIKRQ